MKNKLGQEIIATIDKLSNKGLHFDVNIEGAYTTYRSINKKFSLDILINPDKWLGLNLTTFDSSGSASIEYSIDTDLYNINTPENIAFAKNIEGEIINTLMQLIIGGIKVGIVNNKSVMIIPKRDKYVILSKGKLITSVIESDDINKFASSTLTSLYDSSVI